MKDAPDENDASSPKAPVEEKRPTLYEKVLHSLQNDKKVEKEYTLGQRIGFYKLAQEIGFGNFSRVRIATHVLTKDYVAVKTIDRSKLDQKAHKLLRQEIDNMRILQHPNITMLLEVVESLSHVNLIIDYMNGGDLYNFVMERGRLALPEATPIYLQIVNAVDYLHGKNVIHRDIKAENCLFRGREIVKLADFGFSVRLNKTDDQLTTFCGSPPYAAPELFKDNFYIGIYVDIWALGILLYFVLTGTTPFRGDTVNDIKHHIIEGTYSITTDVPENIRELIVSILRAKPSQRASLKEISERLLDGEKGPKSFLINDRLQEKMMAEAKEICVKTYGIPMESIEKALADDRFNSPLMGIFRITLSSLYASRHNKLQSANSANSLQPQNQPNTANNNGTAEVPSKSPGLNKTKVCSIL